MKRSCETCLWWEDDPDTDSQSCRNPDALGVSRRATSWCAKWEPRDRSLVRCGTCEWFEEEYGGVCHLHPPKRTGDAVARAYTNKDFRCSHWRLREERDDE